MSFGEAADSCISTKSSSVQWSGPWRHAHQAGHTPGQRSAPLIRASKRPYVTPPGTVLFMIPDLSEHTGNHIETRVETEHL